jgi:hypothetical protein
MNAGGNPGRHDGIEATGMSKTAARRTLTEEVADFLAGGPSADEIANCRISAEAQRGAINLFGGKSRASV